MVVPSLPFLAFAAVAALLFNLGAPAWWRQGVLLATNLAFLASFSTSPVAFLPLVGFVALGFFAQWLAGDGRLPRLFPAMVVLTLAVFAWLKRYSFVPGTTYLAFPYLLVGLSYVFFRVLHVLIDRHQGAIEGRVGLVSYLNYTLNFTSLVSGPIQRYQDYRRMEQAPPPLDLVAAGTAIERIVVGVFKVAVVSMLLSLLQHQAIDALGAAHGLREKVWQGVLVAASYPAYLYFNFSGYVDVVVGVARFFRIELPENFNRPFSSENFIAFWGRWHMTLSGWLRTYVYNPLMMAGMSRLTAPSAAAYLSVFAFFVTFFLVGLWHGRTSEFLFFGFLQGGGVAANKLYQLQAQERLGRAGYRALAADPLYRAVCRGLTFTWFTLTLFWFWSDWRQIAGFAHALGPAALVLVWLAILVAATVLLAAWEWLRGAALAVTWSGVPVLRSRYLRTAWDTALVVVTATILAVLDSPVPDIVYKTF